MNRFLGLAGWVLLVISLLYFQRCKKPEVITNDIVVTDSIFVDVPKVVIKEIVSEPEVIIKEVPVYVKDEDRVAKLESEIAFHEENLERMRQIINSLSKGDSISMQLLYNVYTDSVTTNEYDFNYSIPVRGFMEDFDYSINVRPTTVTQIKEVKAPPKKWAASIGATTNLDIWNMAPEIGLMRNNNHLSLTFDPVNKDYRISYRKFYWLGGKKGRKWF